MGDLSKQLRQHAEGAFAVALTPRRNQIYRDLILGSVEIVNDIRQVCMNNTKMTEKQRMEIVFAIRPKLKRMNKKLKHLALAVNSKESYKHNQHDNGKMVNNLRYRQKSSQPLGNTNYGTQYRRSTCASPTHTCRIGKCHQNSGNGWWHGISRLGETCE